MQTASFARFLEDPKCQFVPKNYLRGCLLSWTKSMLGAIHQHRQPSPRIFPDAVGLSRAWCILRGAGYRSYTISRDEGYSSTEFGKIRIRALCYSKCGLPSPDCWSPPNCIRREFSYTTKWDYWCYWWHQCPSLLVWRVHDLTLQRLYWFCRGTICKERNEYLMFSHYTIYSGRSFICPVNVWSISSSLL